ncbi:AfsR/SARP family transcriptional regulator [Streptomyces sp. FH025]|uniref:AfsR/SARP family transcriptional regulator n=1 Tax=Streptomyces sp. FH025 TaxID=2815937 RepID=UPI001FAEA410|nr:AfsR/SARP family transcriptional regulator [Streptomyces sp. FH025]
MLGPVAAVAADGRELALGSPKRRALLAMLLLNPGTPVGVGRLTEALWDGEPPRHSRTVIHNHVSGLRAVLAAAGAPAAGVELLTDGGAYLLRVPEAAVDAGRFEHLVRSASSAREAHAAVAPLREALALWRGPALGGIEPSVPLQCAAQALEESRLAAAEELARAHARLGDHGAAAGVLGAEAAANPLRESLVAALMTALGRAGRRSEALEWYDRTRRALARQLGIDPGAQLAEAYGALLRSDGPPRTPAVESVPETAPSWLFPRRPRGFSGRREELAALDRATASPGAVAVVTGGAGVGKSALAVHWAHLRQADFPDGRLFVDLCGHSPLPERSTGAVLRELLLALGLPAEGMPRSPEAMAARYRELTAGRRMLLVLDNARRSGQVRPLLPDGEGCVTVVTSRERLGGLVASDAARPVPLAELSAPQSVSLLAATLGAEAVAAEREAAARLAVLCDGLPLALRLAAARIATGPARGLAALADELADEQGRLGLLEVEDTSVAAALALTVQHLPGPARRLLRRLGAHTGATLDSRTAAALDGCDLERAARALDHLAAAHLVVEIGRDAYTLHDLVRLYARSLPGPAESADDEAEVLPRLLDHLLRTLLAASAAAEPGSEPCCVLPPDARHPVEVRPFPDRAGALAWYAAERDTLRGAVEAAVAAGLPDRAWRLVLLQWPLIVWQVRDGWVPLLEQGLAAAEADLDPGAQSRARALLGWVLLEEGRPEEALVQLERAPGLAALAGDAAAEAVALVNLAVAHARYGDGARVRGLLEGALALTERRAKRADLAALARQHLADHCLSCGRPEEAAHHAARGLALAEPPFPVTRRVVLQTLYGRALAATGHPEEAALHLGAALTAARAHHYDDGEAAARAALRALAGTGAAVTIRSAG